MEEIEKKTTSKKASRFGVVKAMKLNVRRFPSIEAEISCVINHNDKVIILSDKDSTFYKVNVEGTEGYCMKEFIEEVE